LPGEVLNEVAIVLGRRQHLVISWCSGTPCEIL
jgi:hypothetical protein